MQRAVAGPRDDKGGGVPPLLALLPLLAALPLRGGLGLDLHSIALHNSKAISSSSSHTRIVSHGGPRGCKGVQGRVTDVRDKVMV